MIAPQPDWSALDQALARAKDKGRAVAFWWRDDDAAAHTPALDRLLALAVRFGVPLVLAPVPALVEPSLVDRLGGGPRVGVVVHGLRHANHAPPGEAKAEFGAHRPLGALKADAAAGLRAAQTRFGARLHPVFVPPWNRIAPALVAALQTLGFRGLSAFGDRAARAAAPGLAQVNTHLDPIAWRAGRGLAAPDALIAGIARCIESRLCMADAPEPIGVLTHHLVHDEAIWTFCEALLERLAAHPAVRLPTLDAVFPPGAA
jgi:hypothetical protein